MKSKKQSRLRRAKKTRMKIRELKAQRLVVFKSAKHTYAQIISGCGTKVLTSASTLEKDFDGQTSNIEAARYIGSKIAERAKTVGVKSVAFDRSGFKYHGRVKALAEAAREQGLKF